MDGVPAQPEGVGRLLLSGPGPQQGQYLPLARRQVGERVGRRGCPQPAQLAVDQPGQPPVAGGERPLPPVPVQADHVGRPGRRHHRHRHQDVVHPPDLAELGPVRRPLPVGRVAHLLAGAGEGPAGDRQPGERRPARVAHPARVGRVPRPRLPLGRVVPAQVHVAHHPHGPGRGQPQGLGADAHPGAGQPGQPAHQVGPPGERVGPQFPHLADQPDGRPGVAQPQPAGSGHEWTPRGLACSGQWRAGRRGAESPSPPRPPAECTQAGGGRNPRRRPAAEIPPSA